MGKKVYMTEKQLEECLLSEISEGKNYTIQGDGSSVDAIMNKAKSQYGAVEGDTCSVQANQTSDAKQLADTDTITRQFESKIYTKKQLKEAKLRWLKENCTVVKKKDLFK